jgi:hypothetical protein
MFSGCDQRGWLYEECVEELKRGGFILWEVLLCAKAWLLAYVRPMDSCFWLCVRFFKEKAAMNKLITLPTAFPKVFSGAELM